MSSESFTFLCYKGILYERCLIARDGHVVKHLTRVRKSWRFVYPSGPRSDGYLYYKIEGKTFMAHRAVDESFRPRGTYLPGWVAAHLPGKKRSDIAFGSCIPCSEAENRAHRKLVNKHSTHNTYKGKLTSEDIAQIRDVNGRGISKSVIARFFGVTPGAIRYHLRPKKRRRYH